MCNQLRAQYQRAYSLHSCPFPSIPLPRLSHRKPWTRHARTPTPLHPTACLAPPSRTPVTTRPPLCVVHCSAGSFVCRPLQWAPRGGSRAEAGTGQRSTAQCNAVTTLIRPLPLHLARPFAAVACCRLFFYFLALPLCHSCIWRSLDSVFVLLYHASSTIAILVRLFLSLPCVQFYRKSPLCEELNGVQETVGPRPRLSTGTASQKHSCLVCCHCLEAGSRRLCRRISAGASPCKPLAHSACPSSYHGCCILTAGQRIKSD